MDRFGPIECRVRCTRAGRFGRDRTDPGRHWLLIIATFCAGFCVSGGQKTVNAPAVLFYPAEVRSTGVGWVLGIGRVGGIVGPAAAAG